MVFQKFTHARTDLGEFLFNDATVVGLKKIYRKIVVYVYTLSHLTPKPTSYPKPPKTNA